MLRAVPPKPGWMPSRQGQRLAPAADGGQLPHVGAGDEAVALAGADHEPARRVGLQRVEDGTELFQHLAREDVGAAAGHIDG